MGTVGIRRAVMGTAVEEAGAAERVEVSANRNDDDAQKVVSEAEKENKFKKNLLKPNHVSIFITLSRILD